MCGLREAGSGHGEGEGDGESNEGDGGGVRVSTQSVSFTCFHEDWMGSTVESFPALGEPPSHWITHAHIRVAGFSFPVLVSSCARPIQHAGRFFDKG